MLAAQRLELGYGLLRQLWPLAFGNVEEIDSPYAKPWSPQKVMTIGISRLMEEEERSVKMKKGGGQESSQKD